MVLPFKHGIKIVGLIGALFRSQNADTNDVSDNDLQRLTVLFIHSKQECREHDNNHCHCRDACAGHAFEQKENRQTDQQTAAETNELSFREIEKHLGFYFG